MENKINTLFEGERDRIMRLDKSPYLTETKEDGVIPIGQNIWNAMLANTWFTDEVNLTEDVYDFNYKLTQPELRGFKLALGFASNLDGIQTDNLPINIMPIINETWFRMCLSRQTMEEALHCTQYLKMVDTFELDREEVYNLFQNDKVMYGKNLHIISVYDNLAKNPTIEDKILACFANLALEHIYFYSVFLFFGNLQKLGKMKETAKAIRFIARDEATTHTELFSSFIKIAKKEYPKEYEIALPKAIEMFKEAVNLEIDWGKYIIKDGILGLSDITIEKFVKSLADEAFRKVEEKPIYSETNPFNWFNDWLDFNSTNERFFEGTVMNYTKGESGADKTTKDSFLSRFKDI